MSRNVFLGVSIAALYALHQDLWLWRSARPLVFGFLPIGLAYHAGYCLAAALLMWALTRYAWPSHLDRSSLPQGEPRTEDGRTEAPAARVRRRSEAARSAAAEREAGPPARVFCALGCPCGGGPPSPGVSFHARLRRAWPKPCEGQAPRASNKDRHR